MAASICIGRKAKVALAVACLACAGFLGGETARAVQAAPQWLDGAEIEQKFNNTAIDGRYADGRSFTERYDAGGSLVYTEHGLTMGGHWSVTEGTLCTIYDQDASGGCYRVSRVDTNCYEFYFVSRTEAAAPGPANGKPHWTARGSVQGLPSACRDVPSV